MLSKNKMLIPKESRLSGGITPIMSVQTCWEAIDVSHFCFSPVVKNRNEINRGKKKDFIHQTTVLRVTVASC